MEDSEPGARYAWRVLSVTSIGVLLTGVNTSTLTVALPVVSGHFKATPSQANWILLSYMLVNTVLILAFGRVADLFGRRRMYIFGLFVFTTSSLLCVLAPNVESLIGLRVAQGVGAAAIISNTSALLTDAFPPRMLSMGLGLNVTVASAGQIAGPVIGGALVTAFGWRAVFLLNVPSGALGLVWAGLTLRKVRQNANPESFDFPGAILSFIMISGLVIALSSGGTRGWGSNLVVTTGCLSLAAFISFLVVQKNRKHPLVDLALFQERERAMAYASAFIMAIARYAVMLLCSLFFQSVQGMTPFDAGLRVTPMAVGIMITAPIAGRLARDLSSRVLSTSGITITAGGLLVLFLNLTITVPYPYMCVGLLLVGIGTGMFNTPNTSAIMASVAPERRGIANGLRSTLQNSGFLISTALALAIVTTPLSDTQKAAVYAGAFAGIPIGEAGQLLTGYRSAFFALFLVAIVAGVVSAMRGPREVPGTRRRL